MSFTSSRIPDVSETEPTGDRVLGDQSRYQKNYVEKGDKRESVGTAPQFDGGKVDYIGLS